MEQNTMKCTGCGAHVTITNSVDIAGDRVCSECKPSAVQCLKEGVSDEASANVATHDRPDLTGFLQAYILVAWAVAIGMLRSHTWQLVVFYFPLLLLALFVLLVGVLALAHAVYVKPRTYILSVVTALTATWFPMVHACF